MTKIMPVILLIIFFGASTIPQRPIAQAQTNPPGFEGALIYVRSTNQGTAYIRLATDTRQVYSVPPDQCASVSLGGTYIAQSSPERDDLVVREFAAGEAVLQMPWDPDWETCSQGWNDDIHLWINRQGTTAHEFYDVDVLNGTVEFFVYQWIPSDYPPLPDWMPSTQNNFVLPSPQEGIYLYERCDDQETVGSGEYANCRTETDLVIYDANQQIDVHVLEDPDNYAVTGFDYVLDRWISYGSADWSYTGRYLAFERMPSRTHKFTLSVYDVIADRYLDTQWINVEIDSRRAIQWSPQSNTLAFWAIGRMMEPEPGDDYYQVRTLVFYDADTEQFQSADQAYNFRWGPFVKGGIWSPGGYGFAFVDLSNALIYVDAKTGVASVLDDHVRSVVAWQPDN